MGVDGAMRKIVIDPMTRIEGHLKIEVELDDNNVITEARSSGMLYRGIELILRGRDPRDASRITQRVCGVCPTAHSTASALCLDSAFDIADKVPDNGRIIRNLIFGSNYVHNHILHFYHLAALDYLDVTRAVTYEEHDFDHLREFISRGELAPFVPRYEGDYRLSDDANKALLLHYIQGLDMRRKAQEMLSIFGGKMPLQVGIIAGGVTCEPTTDKIASFLWRLNELREFIANAYIPDVINVAKAYQDYFEIGAGCRNLISYGVFDLDGTNPDYARRSRLFKQGSTSQGNGFAPLDMTKITEAIRYSWYADHDTADVHKEGAYSFIKSPRYNGATHEVGPLARVMVSYAAGDETVRCELDALLHEIGVPLDAMYSVMGRHVARALEAKIIADNMVDWLMQLKVSEPAFVPYELPTEAEGAGFTDAPRGGVAHWIRIENGVIAQYTIISPTTWNASPKDDNDQRGPIEQALVGTKVRDPENPFEIVRIVRSFDPCLACAVHMLIGRTGARKRLMVVG